MDYPKLCQLVGQLFLESRAEIERLHEEKAELQERLRITQEERDNALKTLWKRETDESQ